MSIYKEMKDTEEAKWKCLDERQDRIEWYMKRDVGQKGVKQ